MKTFRSRFTMLALLCAGAIFLVGAAEKPAASKKA
jgi:hypothetical protein